MLQAISPCTQANSEWMFALNESHKLSGERYIMQPLQKQKLTLVGLIDHFWLNGPFRVDPTILGRSAPKIAFLARV